MPASGEGQTRSVYVVQRHFRLVRRGYDPVEVDRHLQVVSDWLRHGGASESARKLEKHLHTRERAVAEREQQAQRLHESQHLEAEATLDGARLRADAELKAAQKQRDDAHALLAHAQRGTLPAARTGTDRTRRDPRPRPAPDEQQQTSSATRTNRLKRSSQKPHIKAKQIAADAEQQRANELLSARAAAEQLLSAIRAQATEESRTLRAQSEADLRAYVQRRHREIDRLVDAKRREHRHASQSDD